ncbi:MAG: retroviral-like aspartic protease family protein [Chloroflexi bacterium]|nr:retroviral-like aspartic protease family protein [Chloroflexota bacterium]
MGADSSAIAEALGYDPAASRRTVEVTTVSTVEVAPVITVQAVRALGFQVENVDMLCHDLPPASRVQGLLGLSFLKNFDVDLHFKRRVLELRDP